MMSILDVHSPLVSKLCRYFKICNESSTNESSTLVCIGLQNLLYKFRQGIKYSEK